MPRPHLWRDVSVLDFLQVPLDPEEARVLRLQGEREDEERERGIREWVMCAAGALRAGEDGSAFGRFIWVCRAFFGR